MTEIKIKDSTIKTLNVNVYDEVFMFGGIT